MISYKLAKQLKEAGFPNTEKWWRKENDKWEIWSLINPFKNDLPCPTLSELIEVCIKILPRQDFHLECLDNNWQASSCYDDALKGFNPDSWITGENPEEAVAKLWLKLKDK